MLNNKTPLSLLVQSLAMAAAYANERLHREYVASVKKLRENKPEVLVMLPPPLSISRVHVSFSANVSKPDRTTYMEQGGDILLDFGKPDGNFQGEIELHPYDPEASSGRLGEYQGTAEEADDQPPRQSYSSPVLSPSTDTHTSQFKRLGNSGKQ